MITRPPPVAPCSRLHRTPKGAMIVPSGVRAFVAICTLRGDQRVGITTFRMNTCKSVSKQRTLTIFRMNTCEKTGGGVTWSAVLLTPLLEGPLKTKSRHGLQNHVNRLLAPLTPFWGLLDANREKK